MSFEKVNIGGYANDGTGDDLREAFRKVNSNFDLLTTEAPVVGGENLGGGARVYSGKDIDQLTFRTLISTDDTVSFDDTDPTVIDVSSVTRLETDPSPTLKVGSNLDLNGQTIFNGKVGGAITEQNLETAPVLINGFSVPDLSALLALVLQSNIIVNNGIGRFSVDLGTILEPAGWTGVQGNSGTTLYLGTLTAPSSLDLDFGNIV